MKILAIHGSPRSRGNTRALLDVVAGAAREAGADVELVDLNELKEITGCRECFACQATRDRPGCAQEDQMQPILDKALESDLIMWATPVFCASVSWLAKIAIDRFFCMFKFNSQGEIDSLLRGKSMAAVITAGGGEDDGADLVCETFRRMAGFAASEWRGAMVGAPATTPELIGDNRELLDKAEAFGKSLAK